MQAGGEAAPGAAGPVVAPASSAVAAGGGAGNQELAVRAYLASRPLDDLLGLLRRRDTQGNAAIHLAAAAGDVEQLQALLAADPSLLFQASASGRQPLAVAVSHAQPPAAALLCSRFGSAAQRSEHAQQVLGTFLQHLKDGESDAGRLEQTVRVLLSAGARLEDARMLVSPMGIQPLLVRALRMRQYRAAEALLRCGEQAQRPVAAVQPGQAAAEQPVQPLHALVAGVAGYYYEGRAHTPDVLGAAQQLLLAGAQLESTTTRAGEEGGYLTSVLSLRGCPVLRYLCGCVTSRLSNQQAQLALIDFLIESGASATASDALGNTGLHRAVFGLRTGTHGSPPFVAVLHRLLTAGADLEAVNTEGLTPLGVLLQKNCTQTFINKDTVEAARALLGIGATIAAAGGGRAWKSVLSTAASCAEARSARAWMHSLMSLLLAQAQPCLDDTSFLGMPAMAHLLDSTLCKLLEESRHAVRVGELVEQLLAADADPNAVDEGQAESDGWAIEDTLADNFSDDEDLASEDEGEAAAPVSREALLLRRQLWCCRRLEGRLSVTGLCQTPLRLSVRLHDLQLTRSLLDFGAVPDGGPGEPLLLVLADEFSVLSWMASFNSAQAERRAVLCWCLDTAEALLDAGCEPFPVDMSVGAPWAAPWFALLDSVLNDEPWTFSINSAFPQPFRAAARTMACINSTCGFGAGGDGSGHSGPGGAARRSKRVASRGKAAAEQAAPGVYLPANVLQHILQMAAGPLTTWVNMMPAGEF